MRILRDLEEIREEKSRHIRRFFTLEIIRLEKLLDRLDLIKEGTDLEPFAREVFSFEPNIEQVTIYDYNFKPLVNMKEGLILPKEEIPKKIRTTIQKNFYFSTFYLEELSYADSTSRLVYFFRSIKGDYFASIVFDYTYLNEIIKHYQEERINLYNSRYQMVSSSRKDYDPRRVIMNPVTDKMITGLSQSLEYKDHFYAFAPVELANESLFIEVLIPVSEAGKETNPFVINMLFFTAVFFLLSLIGGRLFIKYFQDLKERELRKELFTDQYGFFVRMNKSLKNIISQTEVISRLSTSLNYLKGDLETVCEDLERDYESED